MKAALRKKARITSKGQITVPREIRRALGVGQGDTLVFEQDDRGVRVMRDRAKSPFAKYQGIGTPGIGTGRKAILRYMRNLRGR